MMLQKIKSKLALNPKVLFLVDGFGALLSAFSLGIILTSFESIFGMPQKTLYILAFFPCIFAVYDFVCYLQQTKNLATLLKVIAIANLLYCCVSMAFVYHHFQKITTLGLLYFIGECAIIMVLVTIELKTANGLND